MAHIRSLIEWLRILSAYDESCNDDNNLGKILTILLPLTDNTSNLRTVFDHKICKAWYEITKNDSIVIVGMKRGNNIKAKKNHGKKLAQNAWQKC